MNLKKKGAIGPIPDQLMFLGKYELVTFRHIFWLQVDSKTQTCAWFPRWRYGSVWLTEMGRKERLVRRSYGR